MSGRATDHCIFVSNAKLPKETNLNWATIRSVYSPIGFLSCRNTVSRVTIPQANVWSCFCPLGYRPVKLLSVEVASSAKSPSG